MWSFTVLSKQSSQVSVRPSRLSRQIATRLAAQAVAALSVARARPASSASTATASCARSMKVWVRVSNACWRVVAAAARRSAWTLRQASRPVRAATISTTPTDMTRAVMPLSATKPVKSVSGTMISTTQSRLVSRRTGPDDTMMRSWPKSRTLRP